MATKYFVYRPYRGWRQYTAGLFQSHLGFSRINPKHYEGWKFVRVENPTAAFKLASGVAK